MSHLFRKSLHFGLSLLCLAALLNLSGGPAATAPTATVRYVAPNGMTTGTCTSWATACNLPRALAVTDPGDELWIKAGTYLPTSDNNRAISFQLTNGIALYGGFTGTETQRSQRNWMANVTILSGDIGTAGEALDNSYHVVQTGGFNTTAVLDGVTVTGGRGTEEVGGGILVRLGAVLTLVNCRITGNFADYGGGIFQDGTYGGVEVRNSRIELNQATQHGGGIYGNGVITLTETAVMSNSAGGHGGGLHSEGFAINFTGGVFSGNRAALNGGGANASNAISISGTQFISNTAEEYGGGLLQWNADHPITIINAHFERNTANLYGGAFYLANGAPITVTSSRFLSNTGRYGGGGLNFNECTEATLTDLDLIANTGGSGAGIMADGCTNLRIAGSRVLSNTGTSGGALGGGIGVVNSHYITLTGNLIMSNTASYGNGGGAYLIAGSQWLDNNQIIGNSAESGGGLRIDAPGILARLTGNRIQDNRAQEGGGLNLQYSQNFELLNTVIADNKATLRGSGLYLRGASVRIQHATIARNRAAGGDGSGIYLIPYAIFSPTVYYSSVSITNTLFAEHTTHITASQGNTGTIVGSMWDGVGQFSGGNGNFSQAGLFSGAPDLAADGYHLSPDSPAIDQGVASDVTTDIDGHRRPVGSGYDIGADESPLRVFLPLTLRN